MALRKFQPAAGDGSLRRARGDHAGGLVKLKGSMAMAKMNERPAWKLSKKLSVGAATVALSLGGLSLGVGCGGSQEQVRAEQPAEQACGAGDCGAEADKDAADKDCGASDCSAKYDEDADGEENERDGADAACGADSCG